MAVLVLYGSSVVDGVLPTANDMADASGGAETSNTTVSTGSNLYVEIESQGNAGSTGASSIPATPTGKGWVYQPGVGTFDVGNWLADVTLAFGAADGTSTTTIRFFRDSGGVYTLIGTILHANTSGAKTTYHFAPTSMASIDFGASDLLYIDLWFSDPTGVNADAPVVYLSTSSTAGVTGNMQVTTSNFIVSGDPVYYGSNVLNGTVTTASSMANTGGGTETSVQMTIGTGATALFQEICSQNVTDAVGFSGIPATPTGRGWVYQPGAGTYAAGNWSLVVTHAGAASFGTGTTTVTYRAFKYAGGSYTAIGVWPSFAPSSNLKTTYTLTPASFGAVTFAASDLLYIDAFFNDTNNIGGDNPVTYVSTSANAGVVNDMQLTTSIFTPASVASLAPLWHRPRYIMRAITGRIFTPFQAIPAWVNRAFGSNFVRQTTPVNIPRYVRRGLSSILINYGLNISTRFRLMSANQLKDIASRFRQKSADQFKDIATRFRQRSADQLKDIASRFRQRSADQLKDISSRFRLALLKDIASRFRQMSASQLKDVASRFRQKSTDQLKDIKTRFLQKSADQPKDVPGRFRQKSADVLKDIKARLRLMSANQLKDVASRFRQKSADQIRDIAGRFRQRSADQLKDVASRFRQRSADQLKDIATRFILASASQRLKDIAGRFRQRSADQLRDIASRFRQKSADQLKDIVARFRQMSASQSKDVASRFRQKSADRLRDITARLRLMSASQLRDVQARFRQMSANQLRDVASRFRQMSAYQTKDIRARFILLGVVNVRTRDIACRFILMTPADAIWVTRDNKATWIIRDEKAVWDTRDDKASWNTRDDKVTWDTRDNREIWKTRR